MRVERQTLLENVVSTRMSSFGTSLLSSPILSCPVHSSVLERTAAAAADKQDQDHESSEGGEHIRLGLAFGTSEPSDGAEDDDEDDADEEAPAIVAREHEGQLSGPVCEERGGHTRLPFCETVDWRI